jgi:uncharacterized protein YjbI with pentapeptide repeats
VSEIPPEHIIESVTQLRMLAADGELAGKTVRGLTAVPLQLALRGADLDSVTMERVALIEADLSNARLEHAVLRSVDLTGASFEGALLHRVRATDTQIIRGNFTGAEIRRCELGPNLPMHSAIFVSAKIQATTFRQVELARSNFKNAVVLRSTFADYANGVASLNRASLIEAVLIEVDLHEVSLQGADFSRALLIRFDLRGANLSTA